MIFFYFFCILLVLDQITTMVVEYRDIFWLILRSCSCFFLYVGGFWGRKIGLKPEGVRSDVGQGGEACIGVLWLSGAFSHIG